MVTIRSEWNRTLGQVYPWQMTNEEYNIAHPERKHPLPKLKGPFPTDDLQISAELKNWIDALATRFPPTTSSRVIGVGGGFQMNVPRGGGNQRGNIPRGGGNQHLARGGGNQPSGIPRGGGNHIPPGVASRRGAGFFNRIGNPPNPHPQAQLQQPPAANLPHFAPPPPYPDRSRSASTSSSRSSVAPPTALLMDPSYDPIEELSHQYTSYRACSYKVRNLTRIISIRILTNFLLLNFVADDPARQSALSCDFSA